MLSKIQIEKVKKWVAKGYPTCPYTNLEWQVQRISKALSSPKRWAYQYPDGCVEVNLKARATVAWEKLKEFMTTNGLVGLTSSQSENGYVLYHVPPSGVCKAGELVSYFEHPQVSRYDTPKHVVDKYRTGGLYRPSKDELQQLNGILQYTFEELCPV